MRPSATTQIKSIQLSFRPLQKRVAPSFLHVGDWMKALLVSNQTAWMIEWPDPICSSV